MKIVVYGRETPICPACEGAKALLKQRGLPFEWISIHSLAPEELEYLRTLSSTVPLVFIDGQHIGGRDELTADIDLYVKRFAISEAAAAHSVEVLFTKTDGSTRIMYATTNPQRVKDILGEENLPQTDKGLEPKEVSLKVLHVLDIEKRQWRSIPIDRVISYGISVK